MSKHIQNTAAGLAAVLIAFGTFLPVVTVPAAQVATAAPATPVLA